MRGGDRDGAPVRDETTGIEVRPLLAAYRAGWLERRATVGREDAEVATESVRVSEPEYLVQFPSRYSSIRRRPGGDGRLRAAAAC